MRKYKLAAYIILMVSGALGVAFGVLEWPDPLHILLSEVSILLFAVATILQFKLVEIHKTDMRIHELEEDNKNLRIARRVDKEEFAKKEQKYQAFIKTRFGGVDFTGEDITDYIEIKTEAPHENLLEKATRLLPFIKK